MAGHIGRVTKEELDELVEAFISTPLGKRAEVRQYRDADNTGTEVYCNGLVLRAKSNCLLKEKLYKMYDDGTLLKYFKRGFGFDV